MTMPSNYSPGDSVQLLPGVTITYQRQTTQTSQSGAFAPGFEIGFRTPSGTTGQVFVPMTVYGVAAVAMAVNQQAQIIEGIHALNSSPGQ